MNDFSQAITAAAQARRTQSIAFLGKLIAAQRGGEEAVQQCFADHLAEAGCQVESLQYAPSEVRQQHEFALGDGAASEERSSLVARLRGDGTGRSLIFFGHPDGEPMRNLERWQHDPYAATISEGRIYGWGVADDLAGIAIMAEAIHTIMASGIRLRGDVLAASTPSKRHARGVAAVLQHGQGGDGAIYLHPAESGFGMQEIKAVCGGQLNLRITVSGQEPNTKEPGHTAFSHLAVSALDKAMVLKAALDELNSARAARVHHAGIESVVGRATNILIAHITCGDPLRFTRVPMSCAMGASISFPPGENMGSVQQEIIDCLASCAQQDAWLRNHPPVIEWLSGVTGAELPADSALFDAVSAAVSHVTGLTPFVNPMHTSSDIRVPMVQKGIPTVGLGPLCGDLSQNGSHDEWVDVEDYLRAIAVAADSALRWCGAARS
jgi:acetylornithine deacetylase/succinyl-diaminopimelate desuccinylase-like protein